MTDAVSIPLSAALGFWGLILVGVAASLILLSRLPAWLPLATHHAARLRARALTPIETAALILSLLALQSLCGLLIRAAVLNDTASAIAVLLSFHVSILTATAVLLRNARRSWRSAFTGPASLPRDVSAGVLAGAAALPFAWLASLASRALLARLDFPTTGQEILTVFSGAASPAASAILALLAIVMVPVTEELLFRGLLMPFLCRHLGTAAGIGANAFAFALIHAHLPSVAPLFVMGLAFSLAYLATGSIMVPIAMHTLFNFVNLAAFHLAGAP